MSENGTEKIERVLGIYSRLMNGAIVNKAQAANDYNVNEVLNMLAVKSMDVRENFKSLCDKVFRGETLIVSRPKNENIVMMSESEYNEIMKAKRNAEYLAMLDKSMAEAEAGGFITKTVDELGAYE